VFLQQIRYSGYRILRSYLELILTSDTISSIFLFFLFSCVLYPSLVPLTLHSPRPNSPTQSFNYKSFLSLWYNQVDYGTPYKAEHSIQFNGSLCSYRTEISSR